MTALPLFLRAGRANGLLARRVPLRERGRRGRGRLVGFGLDSGIEVSAALILAWRLAQERGQGCTQAADRRATRAIAPVLGSRAAVSEANQTSLCAWLSAVLLAGLAANAALGWWLADLAAVEGVRTWRASP